MNELIGYKFTANFKSDATILFATSGTSLTFFCNYVLKYAKWPV